MPGGAVMPAVRSESPPAPGNATAPGRSVGAASERAPRAYESRRAPWGALRIGGAGSRAREPRGGTRRADSSELSAGGRRASAGQDPVERSRNADKLGSGRAPKPVRSEHNLGSPSGWAPRSRSASARERASSCRHRGTDVDRGDRRRRSARAVSRVRAGTIARIPRGLCRPSRASPHRDEMRACRSGARRRARRAPAAWRHSRLAIARHPARSVRRFHHEVRSPRSATHAEHRGDDRLHGFRTRRPLMALTMNSAPWPRRASDATPRLSPWSRTRAAA